MIEVDFSLGLSDGTRRFTLAPRFASSAPVVALYGASGAGKSLTLQAMAGLLRPEAGHVRIAGRTLFESAAKIDLPARERALGYLFQHYALFPHLSVRENIGFGLRAWWQRAPSAADARRVDELLALFGLEAMAASRPAALSGGQQQRVALARALAPRPRALLLDEPFAALNPMLRAGLRTELAALRRKLGIPVVMITHDIDDIAALADQVFVLDAGRVVQAIDLGGDASEDGALRSEGIDALRAAPLPPEQRLRRQRLQAAFGSCEGRGSG